MAKLSNLKPTLRSLSPKIGFAPDVSRDAARSASQPWRAWYKTKRWADLRRQVLVRDLYTCQRTGLLLTGKHPAPNSPVVDHIKPHRGDPAKFWDPANLQVISKAEHDRGKQREEQAVPTGQWY